MLVIFFVLTAIALFERTSCSDSCVGAFCFTIPGQTASYDSANNWCRNSGSMLAAVYDNSSRMALTQFLESTQLNSTIYLQYKVYKSGNTWNLLNGTDFDGEVLYQDARESDYKLYIYLQNGYVLAANPRDNKNFICEFNASECQNRQTGVSFSSNGRCYVRYDTEALSWFKARERCVKEGGDLAMVQKAQLSQIQLISGQHYWFGIRFSNWTWKYSYYSDGVGREMIYTNWSRNEPNNYQNECVCADPQGSPKWSWSDCDCNTERPFVCLHVMTGTPLPNTTALSSSTSFLASATTTVPVGQKSTVSLQYVTNVTHDDKACQALAIGLGVGIGGAVLLAILIVGVVLLVKRRSAKRDGYSSTRPPKPSEPKVNAKVVNVSASDGNYAEILKDEKNVGNNKNNISTEPVIYQVPTFTEQSDSAPAGRLNKYDNQHRAPDETDVYANEEF